MSLVALNNYIPTQQKKKLTPEERARLFKIAGGTDVAGAEAEKKRFINHNYGTTAQFFLEELPASAIKVGKQALQSTARTAYSIPITPLSMFMGETDKSKLTLKNKYLFGEDQVVEPLNVFAEQQRQKGQAYGESKGLSKTKSSLLGLGFAGLSTTGAVADFYPGGGELDDAFKVIAKTEDAAKIFKQLNKIGIKDDAAKILSKQLIKVDDPKKIGAILDNFIAKPKGVNVYNKEEAGAFPKALGQGEVYNKTAQEAAGFQSKPVISKPPTLISRTGENQAIESVQSPLAKQNLARSVRTQALIPSDKKVISYQESIARPLVNRQEAKEAMQTVTTYDDLVEQDVKQALKSEKIPVQKNPALVYGTENLKDISGFKGQARDVYRNFKAFFRKKFPEVKKQILDPFDAAKGKYVDEQKSLLNELKTNIVGKLGIEKGSKMSAAVMDFGEKLITKDDLVEKFGAEKASKIIEADKWFRSKYDDLLEQVNTVRKQIYPNDPDKIIPKRQDYYRHFQELSGLEGLKNIFETPAGIDPILSGLTPFTKPKSKFLSFAQKRLGLNSDRDAVGGFLNYVPSFSYAKHIDPQIGNFRTLASDLAIQTQESKNANNFIEFLQDYANDLSGKTSAADRFVQKIIPGGRKTFGVLNWLNQRVKANTILGNASSSVAQIFNVPQGVASAKLYSVPGATRTLGSIFTENKAMAKSAFIKERYSGSMFNEFDKGVLANTKQFAVWMTGVMDEIGTKFIWNSHYLKGVGKKLENPVKYADDLTRALVAGRGVGEVPLLQKSKVFQLVAPFQLEVGNLWYVMGDMVKEKDFAGIATLFVASYLMNRVAEKVRGSDVVFDPINAVYEGVQSLNREEDKKKGVAKLFGRVGGEVLSNIPGGQTLAAMYPEYGFDKLGGLTREELFGEGDPTRFGGGLLAIKGLKDPLFKVLPGYGGAQIEKSLQGTGAFLKGRVSNKEGEVQYDIKQTPDNLIRSILFGKYSSPEAQESFDKSKPKELTPEEQRIMPVYQEIQKLKSQNRVDDALELFNELSEADHEIYKKIKSDAEKAQKEELTPKVFDVYKKVQTLKADNKMDEAIGLYNGLNELEKEVYDSMKKEYKDTKVADLLNKDVDKPEKTSEQGFIHDVAVYARALGTDPITAFNRILTGQKIRRVDNGAIIVERMSLDESQSVKKQQGAASNMRLDHTIPLELGGSNAESNLKLVPEEDWKSYTPIENKVARLLKDGKISKKEAQKLIRDFKEGKLKAEEIMNRN